MKVTIFHLTMLSCLHGCSPAKTNSAGCVHSVANASMYALSGMLEYSNRMCTALADVQSVNTNSVNLLTHIQHLVNLQIIEKSPIRSINYKIYPSAY